MSNSILLHANETWNIQEHNVKIPLRYSETSEEKKKIKVTVQQTAYTYEVASNNSVVVESNNNEVIVSSDVNTEIGQLEEEYIKYLPKFSPDSLANEIANTPNTGAILYIIDKSGAVKAITNDFFLLALSMSFKEKAQLMENFDSSTVSFFGDSIKIYSFSCATVDAGSLNNLTPYEYMKQTSILALYENMLRGSKLLENEHTAVMVVNNHRIEGYPLNMQIGYSSADGKSTQFQMTWVIKNHTYNIKNTSFDNTYTVQSGTVKATLIYKLLHKKIELPMQANELGEYTLKEILNLSNINKVQAEKIKTTLLSIITEIGWDEVLAALTNTITDNPTEIGRGKQIYMVDYSKSITNYYNQLVELYITEVTNGKQK